MLCGSAAGAAPAGGREVAASAVSTLPQSRAGLSTEATRSMAMADAPSAARVIAPADALPAGPLAALCVPIVTSCAVPPAQLMLYDFLVPCL